MKHLLLALLLLPVLLVGCAKPSLEETLASAREHASAGEYKLSIIDYKTVLLQQPRNFAVRVELGNVYLQAGLFDEAEKELEKSIDRGASLVDVIGPLAAAMYYQDDYIRVLNRIDAIAEEEKTITPQSAYFHYAASLKARVSEKDSVPIPTEYLSGDYLLLSQAIDALANNNPDAALNLSDQYKNSEIEPFEKSMITATAFAMNGENDNAIEAYQAALKIYSTYYPLRFLLAERLISTHRVEEAETQINLLIELNPASAYANYLLSITEMYHGNFQAAYSAANLATQGGVNKPRAHFIAGVSAYQTGRIEAAYRSLTTATANLPSSHIAHQALARVRLELGYIEELTESLKTLDIEQDISAQIYALAAVQSYQIDESDKAANYIEDSLSVAPDNPAALLTKGLIQFERFDEDTVRTLNRVIDIDPNLGEAWTLKALAEYRDKGIEAGIKVAKDFQSKNELAGTMLEGLLYLKHYMEEEAKIAFERAYKLAPDNNGIGYYVMIANARSNESITALNLAAKLVDEAPNSLEVMNDYLNLMIQHDRDPIAYLDKRIAEHPELAAPVAAKAYLMLLDGKYEQAIVMLKESKAAPHYSTYMALGEALIDAKQMREAADNYKNWTKAFPSDARAWYRYIITLQHLRNYSEALAAVDDALIYSPLNARLKLLKAHFLVSLGENSRAESVLKSIHSQDRKLPEYDQVNGTIAYNRGDYQTAFELLSNAHQRKPTFSTAQLLAYAYAKTDNPLTGMKVLKEQIKKIPKPYYEHHIAAQYASNFDLLDEAVAQYGILDTLTPNNFAVLNNLTNVLIRQDKIDKASELANKIIEMQPKSPFALSTLALVQMKQGDLDNALNNVQRALSSQPNNTEMLLQMGEILLAKNSKLEAQTLLGKISPQNEYERKLYNALREKLR